MIERVFSYIWNIMLNKKSPTAWDFCPTLWDFYPKQWDISK